MSGKHYSIDSCILQLIFLWTTNLFILGCCCCHEAAIQLSLATVLVRPEFTVWPGSCPLETTDTLPPACYSYCFSCHLGCDRLKGSTWPLPLPSSTLHCWKVPQATQCSFPVHLHPRNGNTLAMVFDLLNKFLTSVCRILIFFSSAFMKEISS